MFKQLNKQVYTYMVIALLFVGLLLLSYSFISKILIDHIDKFCFGSLAGVVFHISPHKRCFGGPGGVVRGPDLGGQANICARELASVASRGLQGPPTTSTHHHHPPPPTTYHRLLPPPTTDHHQRYK